MRLEQDALLQESHAQILPHLRRWVRDSNCLCRERRNKARRWRQSKQLDDKGVTERNTVLLGH